MDLTDLLNSIKEAISPGSSAIRTAPGQTYGPAMSRSTRTPINFKALGGESGIYEPKFTSVLGAVIPNNPGQIYIDPTSQDFRETYKGNVSPVVQHESAHAALEPHLDEHQYEALAKTNPQYAAMLRHISDTRAGYMPAEIPAYAAESGAAQRYGIPQNILDLYKQHMQQQTQIIDPEMAVNYGRTLGK